MIQIKIGNVEIAVNADGVYVPEIHNVPNGSDPKKPVVVLPEGLEPWLIRSLSNSASFSTSYWTQFCLETGLANHFFYSLGLLNIRHHCEYRKITPDDCQVIAKARHEYEKRCIYPSYADKCTVDQRSFYAKLLWLENEVKYAFSAYSNPGIYIN